MQPGDQPALKQLRLRYPGTCRGCGAALDAGQQAVYYRLTKQVECLACVASTGSADAAAVSPGDGPEPATGSTDDVDTVEAGTAGASARREYDRRVAKREEQVRAAHPRLGGLILALSDDPQSTQAWARGAVGEERLAKRLDQLASVGVLLLHDRRIPRTRVNIDHIAISTAGVFVIDTKRYQGRPHLQVRGGLFTPRTETLLVGRRDCTKLVDGIQHQVKLVRAALASQVDSAEIAISGMLCFIDADWPLIGGSLRIGGVDVLWPAKATEKITAPGALETDTVAALHRHLASAFPPA